MSRTSNVVVVSVGIRTTHADGPNHPYRVARRDLDEIWDYVAVENRSPVAADNLIDEIGRRLRLVADQPLSGESVERLRKNIRRIIVKKRFLIFYELGSEGIRVLRILHGSRLISEEDLQG